MAAMGSVDGLHIVLPTKEHTHTVIFLHGRDSIASEFALEFFESQASDDRPLPEIFPNFKWVFPASELRTSARFQMELWQWFDMWSVEEPEERKELQISGLKESVASILGIVKREAELVTPENIILGGISQGCATAIHALLHGGVKLGGFIGLCSWLPFSEDIEAIARNSAENPNCLREIQALFEPTSNESSRTNVEQPNGRLQSALATPVFLSHATDDDIVPIANGEKLGDDLRLLGMTVTWKAYEDGGHWINEPKGVDDIVSFLQSQF